MSVLSMVCCQLRNHTVNISVSFFFILFFFYRKALPVTQKRERERLLCKLAVGCS